MNKKNIFYILFKSLDDNGQLAQLVEPLVYTQVVGSSSLSLSIFLSLSTKILTGQLAQLVEPLVYTQVVGSSSLSLSTFRDVAQLVARLVWDQDVAGSNPVIPTLNF